MLENWQSEFLQFALFIGVTVWLVQKGSAESKRLEDAGSRAKRKQRVGAHAPAGPPRWAWLDDWRARLFENSLLLVMRSVFLATWFGQSVNNWRVFNEDQPEHGGAAVSWGALPDRAPTSGRRRLQNWQSEFLAIGTMVVFTIYLRQRGSPESKPVGAPHEETDAHRSERCRFRR